MQSYWLALFFLDPQIFGIFWFAQQAIIDARPLSTHVVE
jgi:hypothetical protein